MERVPLCWKIRGPRMGVEKHNWNIKGSLVLDEKVAMLAMTSGSEVPSCAIHCFCAESRVKRQLFQALVLPLEGGSWVQTKPSKHLR